MKKPYFWSKEKKGREAVSMAEKLSEKKMSEKEMEETEKKASSFLSNPHIKSVKEKLEVMLALIKNPHVSKVVVTSIIGALLYLILPADVVPDFLPVIGLLDDVFVISAIWDRARKAIMSDPEKIGDIVDSIPERLKKPALSLLGAAGGAYAGWKGGEVLASQLENKKLNDVVDGTLKYVRESISQKIRNEEKRAYIKRFASSFFALSLFLMSALIMTVERKGSELWIFSLVFLILSYSAGIWSFISGFRVFLSSVKTARKEKGLRNGMRAIVKERISFYGPAIEALDTLKGKFSFLPSEEEVEKLALKSVRFFWLDIVLFIAVTLLIVLGFFFLRMFVRGYADYDLSIWKLLLFPLFMR